MIKLQKIVRIKMTRQLIVVLMSLPLFYFASGCENKRDAENEKQSLANVLQPRSMTQPGKNVDSPAIWVASNLSESLILLSEKGTGSMLVFRAQRNVPLVTRVEGMNRPNGISIVQNSPFLSGKDLVFVTDRDGNAIHVFTVPDFQRVGIFAKDVQRPMGISTYKRESDGAIFVYVVPKEGKDDAKVIRFKIREEDGKITGDADRKFGKELTVGQETVMVDSEKGRVLVADENARDVKVYDLEGKYLSSFGNGHFQADVEGIVLADCRSKGYYIVSDQRAVTEFEFFDRESFRHLAMVQGRASRTDGIALITKPLPDFPGGLLVAQSDPDKSGGRHAELYDFSDFLKAAGLPPCN